MNRVKTIHVVIGILIATVGVEGSQSVAGGGSLRLQQDFGRAHFKRCLLTTFYNQPARPEVELRCSPLSTSGSADVTASRRLTVEEVETLAKLVVASDLYSGGHVGNFSGISRDGPWERLEVSRCCGQVGTVVLITDGNPTFSTGPRQQLLSLLHKWREPLFNQVAPWRRQ
jgi:hypothetical protein